MTVTEIVRVREAGKGHPRWDRCCKAVHEIRHTRSFYPLRLRHKGFARTYIQIHTDEGPRLKGSERRKLWVEEWPSESAWVVFILQKWFWSKAKIHKQKAVWNGWILLHFLDQLEKVHSFLHGGLILHCSFSWLFSIRHPTHTKSPSGSNPLTWYEWSLATEFRLTNILFSRLPVLFADSLQSTILLWFQLITPVLLASSLTLVANCPPVPDAFTMATGESIKDL